MEVVLVPIAVGLVTLYVGYLLGGLRERQRRKSSLVDDRLATIRAALSHMAQVRTTITQALREDASGIPDEQRTVTTQRMTDVRTEGSGLVQDAHYAARALGGLDLADAMNAVTQVLGTAAERGRFETLGDDYGAKLNTARQLYEALRDKLV